MLLALLLSAATLTAALPEAAVLPDDYDYLYRVTLVRAAPGHQLDMIAHYQAENERLAAAGEPTAFLMRHSQGDHWDLMLLYPMADHAAYYAPDRIAQRAAHQAAHDQFRTIRDQLVAHTEDLFAFGPSLAVVQARFEGMGFFHVEMFKALPGKHAELIAQREMENRYLAAIERPLNLIFVRDQGAPVDVFTLGFYRDIKHFAESADIPLDVEDAAAKAAGFESVYHISPYLRSLIANHHDTLAVAVR